jgi:hypothetical protein
VERKALWKREMNWLLSIADHIVELVPSLQTFEDGSTFEVKIYTFDVNSLHTMHIQDF